MGDVVVLVERAQAGDHTAFDELVIRFRDMAYRQARTYLDDPYLAEDVVQEAFLTAYRRIGQLREPAAFSGWLRRIVLTHCDRALRGHQPHFEPLEDRLEIVADMPSPEASVELAERENHIRLAIAALPEHERAVTEGFYMQGESQAELAERLQVPVTTVKKRLQYARQHLRTLVDELNAAFDHAVAEMLNPSKPSHQPVYIYNRHDENEYE